MNDDDWELFVPERGELYPPKYEYSDRYSKGWVNGLYAGEKSNGSAILVIAIILSVLLLLVCIQSILNP